MHWESILKRKALCDFNLNGKSDKLKRAVLASADSLNHGTISFYFQQIHWVLQLEGNIYTHQVKQPFIGSNSNYVDWFVRWAYSGRAWSDLGVSDIVVGNIPDGGIYIVRSLAIDIHDNLCWDWKVFIPISLFKVLILRWFFI